MIGVSPVGEIEDASEMIPPKSVIDDYEHIDSLTEVIAVQSHRLSEPFFEYLRSALTGHYIELGGSDSEYLMISCPRVIEFEIMVVEWAIKLLVKVACMELIKKSTLEKDEQELVRVGTTQWKLYTVIKLNIVTKKIYQGQLKTLKVLLSILKKLKNVDPEDEEAYAKLTHAPVNEFEASDSKEDHFKRRMGMRTYLMKLKMSMPLVKNAKVAREKARLAQASKAKNDSDNEDGEKSAAAST